MFRRDFLAQLAAGAASMGRGMAKMAMPSHGQDARANALGRGATPSASPAQSHTGARTSSSRRTAPYAPSKQERIAISTWSLHNYFRATRANDFTLPGPMLALLDFPEMIVDRYKVHHFEFCSSHFPSLNPAYLHELSYALVNTRSTIVNILVEIDECGPDGTFSDPDRATRLAALDAVKQWVDVAHTLGVMSVRVGPGKVDPENLEQTAESYKTIAIYAQARDVRVIVENRKGFGDENPEDLVRLLKLAGPGRLGVLPDFANFPDEPCRQRGLKMLFSLTPTVCHATGFEFDADGAERRFDFPQAMEIARKAGFRGVYSIEFNGPGDPFAGIQKTLGEVLKCL